MAERRPYKASTVVRFHQWVLARVAAATTAHYIQPNPPREGVRHHAVIVYW